MLETEAIHILSHLFSLYSRHAAKAYNHLLNTFAIHQLINSMGVISRTEVEKIILYTFQGPSYIMSTINGTQCSTSFTVAQAMHRVLHCGI